MKKIYWFAFAVIHSHLILSQQRPVGFELFAQELLALPRTELVTFDHSQLWAEDMQREHQGGRTNIGRLIPYNENCYTTGVWSQLPNGDRLWQWRFKTANAKGLCVYFDNFQIPLGSSVFLYPADRSHFFGPALNEDCNEHGKFMMGEIAGEEAILEYYQPFEVIGEPTIEMRSVSHMYRNVFAGLEERGGGSDVCEVDVNCPEGSDWVDQRNSVVRLLITEGNFQGLCSGALVNNTSQDCRKFILTALHCGVSTTDADWLLCQVRFNYQRAACGSGTTPSSNNRVGVFRRADSNDNGGDNGSDFLLLELEENPLQSWNIFYAGWDARAITPDNCVGIHHPAGDVKKISTTDNIVSGGWGINGTHWQVNWMQTETNWGVTEGGSSGSPLFNQDKRIVGHLTGGGSCCTSGGCGFGTSPSAPDSYGKLDRDWDNNPNTADQKLKVWLDPTNTGIESMDGSYLVPGGDYPCVFVGQGDEMSLDFDDVSLFPSVGNGHINLSFPDRVKLSSVFVYDQNGRLVHSITKSMVSPQMLNLASLENGVYFITIQSESAHSVTKKIQIIH